MTKLDKDQMDKISGGRAEHTMGTQEQAQELIVNPQDQSDLDQLDQNTAGPNVGPNPKNERLG